ncbi:hypothetical protein [Halopiger thermotolerans]
MDRTERGTVALFAASLGTLAATAVIDDPVVWLAWASATAIVTGAALVAFNR